MLKRIREALGLNKNSPFISEYFFKANMRSSIYMSAIIIVLELWMIIRMTHVMFRDDLLDNFSYLFAKYYSNYLILIVTAVVVLIYASLHLSGKIKARNTGRFLLLSTLFICLYFGINVSLNDYSKGEQILVFVTMVLYAVCLITWRPVISFIVSTASCLYLYVRMNEMVAVNTGKVGVTDATKINFFILWISIMMICISNYNNTRSQAIKDEKLIDVNRSLERSSVFDELTGIHNMVYFRREAEKFGSLEGKLFLFLDIENFKSFNEKYGFYEGNQLLIEVAKAIEDTFPRALVARYSDDHFAVLTDEDGCTEAVNRLAERIDELRRDIHLQLKCGAYRQKDGETDISVACDRARFACNTLKKRYDRCFRLYDKGLEDSFTLRNYILNNIDNAIEKGYIKAYYQPLISSDNCTVCGFEALARWDDPYYGLLSPAVFISTLEDCRQIHKLDLCMMEIVCSEFVKAREDGFPVLPVSLNFSRLDFELCDIVASLDEKTEKYGVPHDFIEVEITESALADSGDVLLDLMSRLRKSGYSVWLDDFGSGYSSLNVLKDHSFDVVKIDMQFLKGFGSNDKTKTILESVVKLSELLGMSSLTEGIEADEQLDFMRSIGCNKLQGYLFGKPVPYDKVRESIAAGKLRISPEFINSQRR